jgi:serine/threonine-protein kinase
MNQTSRSPVDTSLPTPGTVVAGKYRIDGVLGTGGMGVVMNALDTSLGRPVAVKFLAPAKARREGAVPRFLREARAAASLQSEHVVRVFEVSTLPNGAPYIVMEMLRGADLAHIVASRGGLPIEEACDYLLQTCEAVGEAHLRGIVHRDLKPQNLFVTQRPDGSPCLKVLDFGISKAVDEEAPNLTATDTVMGTPLYMSPEQVRSLKNVDHRADIWALGSILFELLTAAPIFEAPSASALCAMIAMDPPIPLRARRPTAPAELEAIILRCLHKDPMGRFQDVAALADALAPFASDRGRQSALRVSSILRSGSGSAPVVAMGISGGAHGMTTADALVRPSQMPPAQLPYPAPVPMVGPSGLPMAPGASAFPPGQPNVPTTQHTWQQHGGGTRTGELPAAAPQKKGSGAVWAVLGGLAALLVAGGAGAFYFLVYLRGHDAKPVTVVDAGAPSAVPAAVVTTPPSASVVPTASAAPPPSSKKPTVASKDAGAPPPTKPSAAPSGPTKEEIDVWKSRAQQRCAFARQRLNGPPPAKDAQLQSLKAEVCMKSFSTSPNDNGIFVAQCDRQVCREICTKLNDNMCFMQLDQADRNNPLPF